MEQVRPADRLDRAVGGKTATVLADALDLHTVGDLLRHYPRRYAERGELTRLADLVVGEHVTVMAEVTRSNVRNAKSTGKPIGEVVVSDGSGELTLTFFGKATFRARQLTPGTRGLFAGTVSTFNSKNQLTHPEFQRVEELEGFAGALIPVYPASAKIQSWNIAKAVRSAHPRRRRRRSR